jgi:hypothetical protein
MFTLLRKIRKSIIAKGKTSNYILYAIGEIVLVVIGILIALQVNNWNEERKLRKEGAQILQELIVEFTDNRSVLENRIISLEEANNYVRLVLDYVNKDPEFIDKTNLDSLISKSLKYGNYNPANSTILELIGAGKLSLISDKLLKKNLYNWLQLLKDTDEDFKNQDQQATTQLIPYLSKKISIKNLNLYDNIGVSERTRLDHDDYFDVFQEIEFENLYQNKLFWNTIMVAHYKELDSLAVEIVNQCNSNLKN